MKAKFLFPIGDVRVAPNSVVEVEIKDADHNNVGFIFASNEIASRWLVLNNAGLLMWPAKAIVSNPRDVSINVSAQEPIAVAVMFDEGVEMEEVEGSVEESEAPAEEAENAAADEVENVASEAATETDESPAEEEEVEEPKKGRKGRK